MLHNRDITVGKCYVNNARKVARKVVGVDHKIVKFDTYHLDTGNSCGSSSECTMQEFKRWADREASPAEIASLQYQELEARFHEPRFPNPEELEHSLAVDPAAYKRK